MKPQIMWKLSNSLGGNPQLISQHSCPSVYWGTGSRKDPWVHQITHTLKSCSPPEEPAYTKSWPSVQTGFTSCRYHCFDQHWDENKSTYKWIVLKRKNAAQTCVVQGSALQQHSLILTKWQFQKRTPPLNYCWLHPKLDYLWWQELI